MVFSLTYSYHFKYTLHQCLIQLFLQCRQQPVVFFRRPETEAEPEVIQICKGGAVTDHQTLTDAVIEQISCRHIITQYMHQDKVKN